MQTAIWKNPCPSARSVFTVQFFSSTFTLTVQEAIKGIDRNKRVKLAAFYCKTTAGVPKCMCPPMERGWGDLATCPLRCAQIRVKADRERDWMRPRARVGQRGTRRKTDGYVYSFLSIHTHTHAHGRRFAVTWGSLLVTTTTTTECVPSREDHPPRSQKENNFLSSLAKKQKP